MTELVALCAERNPTVLRATVAICSATVLVLLVVGCAPSRHSDPFQIAVTDGGIATRWCGADLGPLGYMRLNYRIADGGEQVESMVVQGDFRLAAGDVIGPGQPPLGADVIEASEVPIPDGRVLVFVATGDSKSRLDGPRATFEFDAGDVPWGGVVLGRVVFVVDVGEPSCDGQ